MTKKLLVLIACVSILFLSIDLPTSAQEDDLPILEINNCGWFVEWSMDDTKILCMHQYQDATVFDAATGESLILIEDPQIQGVILNRDATQLMAFGWLGYIKVWDIGSQEQLLSLYVGGEFVTGIWSPTEEWIGSPSGQQFTIWDATSGDLITSLDGRSAMWNSSGSKLVTWNDSRIQVLDTDTLSVSSELETTTTIYNVLWSPNDQRIAIRFTRYIEVWDTKLQRRYTTFQLPRNYAFGQILWNTDGTHLLLKVDTIDSEVHWVIVWRVTDQDSGVFIYDIPYLAGTTWRPQSTDFVAWSNLLEIAELWQNGEPTLTIESEQVYEYPYVRVDWSPDGQYMNLWGTDATVQIWNAVDGKLVQSFHHVHNGEAAPEGSLLGDFNHQRTILATNQGNLNLWAVE